MDQTNKQGRLSELDTLRGIAAVSVCLFHFALPGTIFNPSFLRYGCTGVDLFFMISGFVIFMSLTKITRLKEFWIARFYRLYPGYWVSIAIAILTFYIFGTENFNTELSFLLGNVLMIQPVFKTAYLVGAYWTLYVELCFYLFIGVIWYIKKMDKVENIAIGCLLLIMILNGLYAVWDQPAYISLFVMARRFCPLLSHINMFIAGIIFYRIFWDRFTVKRSTILIACYAATALAHNFDGHTTHFVNIGERLICDLVYFSLFVLLTQKRLPFANVAGAFFGAISYSLYLIHQSLGLALANALSAAIGPELSIGTGIIASVALAALITYLIEKPILKWSRKFYKNVEKEEIKTIDFV